MQFLGYGLKLSSKQSCSQLRGISLVRDSFLPPLLWRVFSPSVPLLVSAGLGTHPSSMLAHRSNPRCEPLHRMKHRVVSSSSRTDITCSWSAREIKAQFQQ